MAICPSSLPPLRAQWLFALLSRLEKPLLPDIAATLRALHRHCAHARNLLGSAEEAALPALDVLLAVAGGYFGQDEVLCKWLGVEDFHELM